MAVDPLQQLTITVHPLGNELRITWILPDSKPTNYQVYLFKRSDSEVSEDDVTDYMDSGITASGLTVFDSIESTQEKVIDITVDNGTTYYYKAVLKDTDSGEYSNTISGNETPSFSGTINIVDWKDIIAAATKRILKNYSAENYKDYEVNKAYSLLKPVVPCITIVRQNSQDVQRFWGNLLKDTISEQQFGKIEQENILVVWEDVHSERRDKLTFIFKAHEQTFLRYVMQQNGAVQFQMIMGSDGINAQYQDGELHTGEMLLQILHQSSISHEDQDRRLQLDDVIHNGHFLS